MNHPKYDFEGFIRAAVEAYAESVCNELADLAIDWDVFNAEKWFPFKLPSSKNIIKYYYDSKRKVLLYQVIEGSGQETLHIHICDEFANLSDHTELERELGDFPFALKIKNIPEGGHTLFFNLQEIDFRQEKFFTPTKGIEWGRAIGAKVGNWARLLIKTEKAQASIETLKPEFPELRDRVATLVSWLEELKTDMMITKAQMFEWEPVITQFAYLEQYKSVAWVKAELEKYKIEMDGISRRVDISLDGLNKRLDTVQTTRTMTWQTIGVIIALISAIAALIKSIFFAS